MTAHFFIYEVSRWIVGGVFLLSGLFKLNDLGGFSLKIAAYLEIFSFDLSSFFRWFLPCALPMAWVICLLEVGLGTALLVRWNTTGVVGSLWVLATFFAFLTGYTFWFKRMESCGCLGEILLLTPRQSFLKNIFLWILLALLYQKRLPMHSVPSAVQAIGLSSTLLIGLLLGWYGLSQLPFLDIGSYAKGTSISERLQPTSSAYRYWVEKEGKISAVNTYPTDSSYRVIKTEWLQADNAKQKPHFRIWDREKEMTKKVLRGSRLVVVLGQPARLTTSQQQAWQELLTGLDNSIAVLWLLPFENEKGELPISMPSPWLGWAQAGLLRALLPATMGLVWLQEGVIKGKWSYRSLEKAKAVLRQQGLYNMSQ